MADELLVFTAFVALAQIVVGLVLLLIGVSSAVHIIGVVVLVFGCLTAAGPAIGWWRGRRSGDGTAPDGPTVSPPPR